MQLFPGRTPREIKTIKISRITEKRVRCKQNECVCVYIKIPEVGIYSQKGNRAKRKGNLFFISFSYTTSNQDWICQSVCVQAGRILIEERNDNCL
jgi:hypothetical protein